MSESVGEENKRWFGMTIMEWALVVMTVSAIVACLLWMSVQDLSRVNYLDGFSNRATEYGESLPDEQLRAVLHGFRTPLHGCLMYSELATRKGGFIPPDQEKRRNRNEQGAATFDACLHAYLEEIAPMLDAGTRSILVSRLDCAQGCELPALGRYGPWTSLNRD